MTDTKPERNQEALRTPSKLIHNQAYHIQNAKTEDKNLKGSSEKKMTLPTEKAKNYQRPCKLEDNGLTLVLKEKQNSQFRILYPLKISFKMKKK